MKFGCGVQILEPAAKVRWFISRNRAWTLQSPLQTWVQMARRGPKEKKKTSQNGPNKSTSVRFGFERSNRVALRVRVRAAPIRGSVSLSEVPTFSLWRSAPLGSDGPSWGPPPRSAATAWRWRRRGSSSWAAGTVTGDRRRGGDLGR